MPKYEVNRFWEMWDRVTVEAESPTDAIQKAHQLPLSDKAEYVADSISSHPKVDVRQSES